ncbi:protein FAM177B [Alosa pseudoharengus]|uniref:protein FAM177B n=1 Tax=Alosa pseudoharengus TaxID=34774 RepID=UPI003F8A1634
MNDNLTRGLHMQETSFDHRSHDRRIIYFANGETLEESEGEEENDEDANQKEPFSQAVDTTNLSWGEYSRFLGTKIGKKSLQTCDYLGEKLARLLGLHSAKYQYAIDEFKRDQKEKNIKEESSDVFMEDDTENINLAQKKSRKYGATGSPKVASPQSSISAPSVKRMAVGTNNNGYQDDDQ